jgi:hypothetical protein
MKKLFLAYDKDNLFKTIGLHDLESLKVFSQRSLIHSNSFQQKLNHTWGSFLVRVDESKDQYR